MEAPDGGWWRDRALCADPRALPLVDAAFAGEPEARTRMVALCRRCPVRLQCGTEALGNPVPGVWGGLTGNQRTRHGAPTAARSSLRLRPVTV